MKTQIFTFAFILGVLSANLVFGKKFDALRRAKLPSNLELSEPVPQKYEVTTTIINRNIFGKFMDKEQLRGNYTRGLENKQVRWNNVESLKSQKELEWETKQSIDFMENFTYKPGAEMLLADAFPANDLHAKNLVWDMMGLESFAWIYFDSLKLNLPIVAKEINGEVEMEGVGSFTNKNIVLTWKGITVLKGEECAIVEFRTMDNPLVMNIDVGNSNTLKMNGRSHYWGNVLVSLKDKQIEGAELLEDVVLEVDFPGQEKQLVNSVRTIEVKKQ